MAITSESPIYGKRVIFIRNENDNENADGVRGHLQIIGDSYHKEGLYEKVIKRCIDFILSSIGLLLLIPIFILISLAIVIENPGPVFLSQKRIGRNKSYFVIHKFRSMKIETPSNIPTHMLDNADIYITKVGYFIRKHSLDELPQLWDVLIGNMSLVGPRPALWNQEYLIAERDKYGANDIKPGLTGWAQINGRDKIDITVKAKLDGEYLENLNFYMDLKCILKTLHVFSFDDSIQEGNNSMNL